MAAPESRLKVVFIGHVARLSGGEIALTRLLSALDGDIEPYVILGEDGPLVERLREMGIAVEILSLGSDVRDVRRGAVGRNLLDLRVVAVSVAYVWRLAHKLRELRPDIVHTNTLKAALYGGMAGRMAGVPVIWHIHDRIAVDYLPAPARIAIQGASFALPSAIIANSDASLSTLRRKRCACVVYNPIDVDAAKPVLRRGEQRRPLTIGVVGRLAPWKGQHVFLQAFAETFRGTTTRARLIGDALFGEKSYVDNLRVMVDRLGIAKQIELRGFRNDVWAELADLDILVHCSTVPEPFGQVVVEGMAAGLAVVASAAGGPTEIARDGVDCLLTAPGDVKALVKALTMLANDPELREQLGGAARERSRYFSPQRAAKKVLAVYEVAQGSMIPTD